jgi:hypothetical protein
VSLRIAGAGIKSAMMEPSWRVPWEGGCCAGPATGINTEEKTASSSPIIGVTSR